MSVQNHNRHDMALKQLETALSLYFSATDDYSVIILAASADDIFGQLLTANGQESSLETIKQSVVAIHGLLHGTEITPSSVAYRANFARNSLKHWSADQSLVVSFDAHEEAKDMLNRAIDNYWTLTELFSPAMERFQREIMQT